MLMSASHSCTHGLYMLTCAYNEHEHWHGNGQVPAGSSPAKKNVQCAADNTERELISVKRPSVLQKKPRMRDSEVGMAEGDLYNSPTSNGTAIAAKFLPDNFSLKQDPMQAPRQLDATDTMKFSEICEPKGAQESLTPQEVFRTLEALKLKLAQGDLKPAIDQLESLPIEVLIDSATHSLLLKQCARMKSIVCGKRVHEHIRRQGLHQETFLGNNLINMYRHCGDLGSAASVFYDLHRKNVFSWTIMISAYAQHGQYVKALELFYKMQDEKVKPDKVTVSTIIGACSSISALEQGREIHLMIMDGKLESDIVVESALVNMYIKCGSLDEGQMVFDGMQSRNVVAWTIMVTAYAQHNMGLKALQLFGKMDSCGVAPNEITLVGALSACSGLKSLASGQHVHAVAVYHGFQLNVAVGNALIHVYGKCGNWQAALKVFSKMNAKDVISWTSMLDAYLEHGRTKDTLQLFEEMQWEGIIPDKVTFLSVLGACGDLAAFEQGKKIHSSIISRRLHADQLVGCALIHMYGKCGSVEGAREVFDNIPEQNVHTWTAMITVYSQHGLARKALILFSQMLREQVKPNEITFVSVLSACSHGGFVAEGWRCFASISKDFGITPTAEHYACMVDMLGRGGFLKEAEDFIQKMHVEANVFVWRTMLSVCIMFNDVERGKWAAEKCIQMEPGYGAPYVLLSNIYAAYGQWEEVDRIRKLMEANGAKKQPGRSAIEIKDKVHEFVVDDQAHPRIEEIYAELDWLSGQMEEAGYVREAKIVLHDVEEEVKPHLMKVHSERLAIVFGHIMTPPKSALRIVKNLRVCVDCHCAVKFISKIFEREIIVRDSHCFHHFKDGVCSCRDYW